MRAALHAIAEQRKIQLFSQQHGKSKQFACEFNWT
jgi:hypothetical protein